MAGLANRKSLNVSISVPSVNLSLNLNLIPSKSRADKQNVTLSLSADDTHFCLFFSVIVDNFDEI